MQSHERKCQRLFELNFHNSVNHAVIRVKTKMNDTLERKTPKRFNKLNQRYSDIFVFRYISVLLNILLLSSTATIMCQTESRWEPTIQRFEAMDAENKPPEGTILFVGSSSIVFWRSLATDMAPLKVINRGFGGSQMFELNMFRDRIVTNYKPRVIVVYEGDNDVAAGKSTEAIIKEYKDFVSHIDTVLPDTDMCFISVKPSISRAHMLSQQTEVNQQLKAIADTREDMCYFDVATPVLNDKGEINPDIFVADNLHLNEAGYRIWTKVIKPVLIERYGTNSQD